MKNIHVLPTDKPSKVYRLKNKLYFEKYPNKTVNAGNQNIYITSDEEIKEGCYVMSTLEGKQQLEEVLKQFKNE